MGEGDAPAERVTAEQILRAGFSVHASYLTRMLKKLPEADPARASIQDLAETYRALAAPQAPPGGELVLG